MGHHNSDDLVVVAIVSPLWRTDYLQTWHFLETEELREVPDSADVRNNDDRDVSVAEATVSSLRHDEVEGLLKHGLVRLSKRNLSFDVKHEVRRHLDTAVGGLEEVGRFEAARVSVGDHLRHEGRRSKPEMKDVSGVFEKLRYVAQNFRRKTAEGVHCLGERHAHEFY